MIRRYSILLIVCLVLLLATWFGAKLWLERQMIVAIEEQLILLPDAVDVQYGRVEVELPSLRAHIHDLAVRLGHEEPPIRVRRLTIHDVDRRHRLPRHLNLELHGVRQDVSTSRQSHARFLRRYGLKAVAGNMALRYHFEAEEQELQLDQLLIELVPLGRLDLTADLQTAPVKGVLYRDWRPEEAVALEKLIASWEDMGLVQRMMAMAAEDQGMTAATLAANIAAELNRSAAALETPRLDITVETLQHFLRDTGAITLYLEPVQPLPLTALRDTALVNPPKAALDARLFIQPGRWR